MAVTPPKMLVTSSKVEYDIASAPIWIGAMMLIGRTGCKSFVCIIRVMGIRFFVIRVMGIRFVVVWVMGIRFFVIRVMGVRFVDISVRGIWFVVIRVMGVRFFGILLMCICFENVSRARCFLGARTRIMGIFVVTLAATR